MTDGARAHGLLMALMEPDPGQEEEFNDWYDLEHIPQMSTIPGILTATRWICVEGWPRYLAMYDLEHIDVLSSDAYRQNTGRNFTPWSRRILGRVRGWRRIALAGLDPAADVTPATAEALDVLFAPDSETAARLAGELQRLPALIQARAFDVPDEGVAATIVDSGALHSLGHVLRGDGNGAPLRGSARYVRYYRRDPFAAFHAIDAGEAH
jgi:hypothetical protein